MKLVAFYTHDHDLDRLVDASANFSNQVQRTHLSPELEDLLSSAMRISGYYTAVAELATEIAADKSSFKPREMPVLQEELSHFKSSVVKFLKMFDTKKDATNSQVSAA